MTALTINRLADREVGAMIDRVVGNKLLPPNIRQDIIEGREPARVVGTSLHRGWADREGRGAVGQSGTAIVGALGAG